MKVYRYLSVIFGLMLAAGTASADRTMVVVLDASGSMQAIRSSDGLTRFVAAKEAAKSRVMFAATMEAAGLSGVAVYTFHGTTVELHSTATPSGFITPFQALTLIDTLSVTFQTTPLADALCVAIDKARASGSGTTTDRFVEVYSDGFENTSSGPCSGPYSVGGAPYDVGSWQHFVFDKATNGGPPAVTISATLFLDVANLVGGVPSSAVSQGSSLVPSFPDLAGVQDANPASSAKAMPFGNPLIAGLQGVATTSSSAAPVVHGSTWYATAGAGSTAYAPNLNPINLDLMASAKAVNTTSNLISDEEFFAVLAAETGGDFAIVGDSEPLPVFADVDGDYDVDRDDAIRLALNFGGIPVRTYDLNADGEVGFADYEIVLARMGTGGGAADPYTTAGTVLCAGGNTVVIDGKAIESASTTIFIANSCNVVIRNSLIVSGGNGIRVIGGGVLTVENSYVIGEGAWLNSRGSVVLRATNSRFHGNQITIGRFAYRDGGGNVFD